LNLAHGATVLHGDDVVTFAIACAVALLVLGGVWFSARRTKRRSS
jgi:uncharacterized membrane protein